MRRSWAVALAAVVTLGLAPWTRPATASRPPNRPAPIVVRRQDARLVRARLALDTLAFTDVVHGWAGGAGVILRTDNGGRTWRRVWSGTATVTEVVPIGAEGAVAVTRSSLIATSDGGRHWRRLAEPGGNPNCGSAPGSPCAVAAAFPTSAVGYAVAGPPPDLGTATGWVTVSADGRWLYTGTDRGVTAFDLAHGRLAWDLPLPAGAGPLALSPDGGRLYILGEGGASLIVVDTARRAVLSTVTVPDPSSCAVAASPDGRWVVVGGERGVSLLDAATGRPVATVPFGQACALAVSPDGARVYVAGAAGKGEWGIGVVDLHSRTVVQRWPDAALVPVNGLAVSTDGRALYVSDLRGQRVDVVDTATGRTVQSDLLPPGPTALAVDGPAGRLFAVVGTRLVAVDLQSGRPVASTPLPGDVGIATVVVAPHGTAAYATGGDGVVALAAHGATARRLATAGVRVSTVFGVPVAVSGAVLYKTTDGGRTWVRLPTPAAVQSACFVDARVGFAAAGADLYVTRDGGRTWSRAFAEPIQSVPEPSTAVLCRGSSVLLETTADDAGLGHMAYIAFQSTDGGRRFAPTIEENYMHMGRPGVDAPEGPGSYPGPATLTATGQAIYAGTSPSSDEADLAVPGPHGLVLRPVPGVGGLGALAFPTATTGWALTGTFYASSLGHGRILRTDDGGRTWRQVFPTVVAPVYGVSFPTPALGFGIGLPGDAGAVVRSDDGGQRWRRVGELPVTPSASATVAFVDAVRGFATASGRLFASVDGGRTWRPVDLGDPNILAVDFAGHDGCALGGRGLFVSVDGGRTWRRAPGTASTTLGCPAEAADPRWRQVQATVLGRSGQFLGASGADTGWATLDDELLRTTDGGRTWTAYAYPSVWRDDPPSWFGTPSATVVVLQTWSGDLYRSDDGGATWVALP